MYSSSGLAEAIILGIILFIAIFITGVVLIWKGRQTGNIAMKRTGYAIVGTIIVGLSIHAARETLSHQNSLKLTAESEATFMRSIPAVYAPDLPIIEKDPLGKKPQIRAILDRDDVYEFVIPAGQDGILEHRLRGYPANATFNEWFNPLANICSFQRFYPQDTTADESNYTCTEAGKTADGNSIYTSRVKSGINQQLEYFGVAYPDTLVIFEAYDYADYDPQTIIKSLSSLKKYDHGQLETVFTVNADHGLSK